MMEQQQAADGQLGQDDQQQQQQGEEEYEEYDQGSGAQPISCLEVRATVVARPRSHPC
jgi:hypothetical protein